MARKRTTKTMITLKNIYGQESVVELLDEGVAWGKKFWSIRNDYGTVLTVGEYEGWSEASRKRVKKGN